MYYLFVSQYYICIYILLYYYIIIIIEHYTSVFTRILYILVNINLPFITMCLKPVECMRSYEDLFNYFAGTWGPNNHRQREKVGAISCCGLWYPIWAKLVQNSCLRLHWKLINHTLPFNVPWCYYPVNQPTSTSNNLKN